MLRKLVFTLQALAFLLTLTTLARAGYNGVQVLELPSQVSVQVFQTNKGKDFRVFGQNRIKARLTCSVSGFRVKRLGPGAAGAAVPTTGGGTKATSSWYLGKLDLQPHFSKMVSACNTGQKSFQLNFLPAHACYRKKGIASAGAAVNQSKPLTVKVECAAVNKKFYTLPHKSCSPVSSPRSTKTGYQVSIGCSYKPGTLPKSGNVAFRYVDTLEVLGRRVQLPSQCKLPKQFEWKRQPGPNGKIVGLRVGLVCSKYQKGTFSPRFVDGVKVEFINAVHFNNGIPIVALPSGCSQVNNSYPYVGGRWVQIACGSKHGSGKPVNYVQYGKTLRMRFSMKPFYVAYGSVPGPLAVVPIGCIQQTVATGSGPKGKTVHKVNLVCIQNKSVPPVQNHGQSKIYYKVTGRVPQGCTPVRTNGPFAVYISCKPPVVCKNSNTSQPPVVCLNQGD